MTKNSIMENGVILFQDVILKGMKWAGIKDREINDV